MTRFACLSMVGWKAKIDLVAINSPFYSRIVCALLWVAFSTGATAADTVAGFEGDLWLQDADGLYEALRAMEEKPQPMVVYFYTDWCGYCRQFERELLGTPEVKEYFAKVLTVRINPESGAEERQVADYYGVRGFPGFFVHSGDSKTLSKVERMVFEDGRPRIMAPAEFIVAVETAGSR